MQVKVRLAGLIDFVTGTLGDLSLNIAFRCPGVCLAQECGCVCVGACTLDIVGYPVEQSRAAGPFI